MKQRAKVWSKFIRGAGLVLAGVLLLHLPFGCAQPPHTETVQEGDQTVYSDGQYAMVQGKAIRKPGTQRDSQYVFLPLTFQNHSDNNIIFSSRVCVKAYALPSCTECESAPPSGVAYGRANVKGFRLFDGILYGQEDTEGWLVFEVPTDTEAVQVDFYISYHDNQYLSFNCKI